MWLFFVIFFLVWLCIIDFNIFFIKFYKVVLYIVWKLIKEKLKDKFEEFI